MRRTEGLAEVGADTLKNAGLRRPLLPDRAPSPLRTERVDGELTRASSATARHDRHRSAHEWRRRQRLGPRAQRPHADPHVRRDRRDARRLLEAPLAPPQHHPPRPVHRPRGHHDRQRRLVLQRHGCPSGARHHHLRLCAVPSTERFKRSADPADPAGGPDLVHVPSESLRVCRGSFSSLLAVQSKYDFSNMGSYLFAGLLCFLVRPPREAQSEADPLCPNR